MSTTINFETSEQKTIIAKLTYNEYSKLLYITFREKEDLPYESDRPNYGRFKYKYTTYIYKEVPSNLWNDICKMDNMNDIITFYKVKIKDIYKKECLEDKYINEETKEIEFKDYPKVTYSVIKNSRFIDGNGNYIYKLQADDIYNINYNDIPIILFVDENFKILRREFFNLEYIKCEKVSNNG